MDPKDIIALTLSGAALFTSIGSTRFNILTQRRRENEDNRRAFDEAISSLQSTRSEWQDLRHELGEEFESERVFTRRVVLVSKRNLYLSKALRLHQTHNLVVSSSDAMILAATLIETGRVANSVKFYELSVAAALDDFDRELTRRVLGRAKLLSGDLSAGRDDMIQAAVAIENMASDRAYNRSVMYNEATETYRRLLEVCLEERVAEHLDEDIRQLERLHVNASGPSRSMAASMLSRARVAEYMRRQQDEADAS